MNTNDRYQYRVTWSDDDDEHVATVVEFPSLSWLAEDPAEALAGLRQLVQEVIEDMQASGETVPVPLADRNYSGRFVLRAPKALHRELVLEAAEQSVSLNQYVLTILAKRRQSESPKDERPWLPLRETFNQSTENRCGCSSLWNIAIGKTLQPVNVVAAPTTKIFTLKPEGGFEDWHDSQETDLSEHV